MPAGIQVAAIELYRTGLVEPDTLGFPMAKAKDVIKQGDVLGGKYRVERVIGQGGMGIVVAARHTELHQRVALKLLLADQLDDKDLVERFMREARAVARLKSEHAVKVIDVGKRSNGSPYIVMELLEGNDLGHVVERTPLPVPVAVDYLLQACEAVAEAHALGIVHRDLKPRNLFLSARVHGKPHVKVLDFGLAKRIDMQDHALTATTAVMGSPQYMSPEQMKATRNVDYRTDIWSLGVCLYELVSGRVPFESDAVPVLCAMVLKEDPTPLPAIRPDVPPGLWHIIQTCLQKEPGDRYSNVAELAKVLEPFAPEHSRGSTERISAVLFTTPTTGGFIAQPFEPEPDLRDTRTNASFDSDSNERRGMSAQTWVAIGVGAFVGVATLIAAMVVLQPFKRTPAPAREPNRTYEPAAEPFILSPLPMGSAKGVVAPGSASASHTSTTAVPTTPTAPAPKGSTSAKPPPPKPEERF